jgi:hypothetical protein
MISFQVKRGQTEQGQTSKLKLITFSPDFINFPTNYMIYLMLNDTDQLMHISMTMNFNII